MHKNKGEVQIRGSKLGGEAEQSKEGTTKHLRRMRRETGETNNMKGNENRREKEIIVSIIWGKASALGREGTFNCLVHFLLLDSALGQHTAGLFAH